MILAVTPGDPDGIGPEIILKALLKSKLKNFAGVRFLLIGAFSPFKNSTLPIHLINERDLRRPNGLPNRQILFLAAPTKSRFFLQGYQSGWSIQKAVELTRANVTQAIVTGPISKERLNKGGFKFPGHTEMLEHFCDLKPNHVTMMLANSELKVSLATTHLSLKDVPKILNTQMVVQATQNTIQVLKEGWGIKNPKIAVLALNPHAGENGLFGIEERTIILPAIIKLRSLYGKSVTITGPHPADTFFAKNHLMPRYKRYDAVICAYHDQGLIPVKLLDFPRTVNITLGLPIIRTSVDHGVGFDIVGKKIADSSSFIAAVKLAAFFVKKMRLGLCH